MFGNDVGIIVERGMFLKERFGGDGERWVFDEGVRRYLLGHDHFSELLADVKRGSEKFAGGCLQGRI